MSKIIPFKSVPNDGTMIMPWGKHKGVALEDIPSPYLVWLCDHSEDSDLVRAAQTELKYRERNDCHFDESGLHCEMQDSDYED